MLRQNASKTRKREKKRDHVTWVIGEWRSHAGYLVHARNQQEYTRRGRRRRRHYEILEEESKPEKSRADSITKSPKQGLFSPGPNPTYQLPEDRQFLTIRRKTLTIIALTHSLTYGQLQRMLLN